jgi:hypothetical protein
MYCMYIYIQRERALYSCNRWSFTCPHGTQRPRESGWFLLFQVLKPASNVLLELRPTTMGRRSARNVILATGLTPADSWINWNNHSFLLISKERMELCRELGKKRNTSIDGIQLVSLFWQCECPCGSLWLDFLCYLCCQTVVGVQVGNWRWTVLLMAGDSSL